MEIFLKNGNFVQFKYPEAFYDSDKLYFYSVECRFINDKDSKSFNPKEINYQEIVEINDQNKKYIEEFIFLFCKPTKDEMKEFLCNLDRYEDYLKIKNNEEYSTLLTKKKQNENSIKLINKLK